MRRKTLASSLCNCFSLMAVAAAGQPLEKPGEIKIKATGHCFVRVDDGAPSRLKPGDSLDAKVLAGAHVVHAESAFSKQVREYPADVAPGQRLDLQIDLAPLALDKLREKGVPFDQGTYFDTVRRGATELLRLFLDAGMSADTKDGEEWPVLVRAAHRGHVDIIKVLIDAGVDVNATTRTGRTAAMWAALHGRSSIVRELVAARTDLNKKDKVLGDTALMLAAAWGQGEVVESILQTGSTEESKSGRVLRTVLKVFDKGRLDLDETNRMGWTALMYAARYGHIEITRRLVEAGAKTDKVDELRRTAQALAEAEGQATSSSYLRSVDPKKKD